MDLQLWEGCRVSILHRRCSIQYPGCLEMVLLAGPAFQKRKPTPRNHEKGKKGGSKGSPVSTPRHIIQRKPDFLIQPGGAQGSISFTGLPMSPRTQQNSKAGPYPDRQEPPEQEGLGQLPKSATFPKQHGNIKKLS